MEDLVDLSTQLWSRRPLTEHAYCQFHHLLAPGGQDHNKPMDDVNRSTLILKGYAEKDGVRTIIDLRSAFAGILLEFDELSLILTRPSKAPKQYRLCWKGSRMWFDGIDLFDYGETAFHQVGEQILETCRYHLRAIR